MEKETIEFKVECFLKMGFTELPEARLFITFPKNTTVKEIKRGITKKIPNFHLRVTNVSEKEPTFVKLNGKWFNLKEIGVE